jgi:acetylornithine deacetylase/succinyl-diaminopimelate desuccinylase-like protein
MPPRPARNKGCNERSRRAGTVEMLNAPKRVKVSTDAGRLDRYFRRLLTRHGVDYRVVATFDAGRPGRHFALNGHIDVFPADDGEG